MMTKPILASCAALLTAAVPVEPAGAWSHASRAGGTVSHEQGSGETTRTTSWGASETHTYGQGTTATSRYGGSATHEQGEGTTATNRYGDTATHAEGSGQTTFTNPSGGTATHTYGEGTTATTAYGATVYHPPGAAYGYHEPYYSTTYAGYHPPTTVNYYGSSCGYCGGWAAAGAVTAGAVGVAAGASMASANTAAATSAAYNAGVATGAGYAMGSIAATLPAGCMQNTLSGKIYYLCGSTWFSPAYGANGLYYRVVPTP
jgi:hypothetical protein